MSPDQPMRPVAGQAHDPSTDDKLCGHHGHRNKRGEPCKAYVVKGTKHCPGHAGTTLAKAKAKGAVVVELRQWGLTEQRDLADPGTVLLRLVTQSAARCDLYASLLEQAYDAADRLSKAGHAPGLEDASETALLDLERIFNHGAVGALVGHKYASTPSGPMATGEAIRGLVELEATERDRCANFAAKAVAAGLAERQVRLAEQMGGQLATAITAVVSALGHSPQDPAVQAAITSQLSALFGDSKVIEGTVAA